MLHSVTVIVTGPRRLEGFTRWSTILGEESLNMSYLLTGRWSDCLGLQYSAGRICVTVGICLTIQYYNISELSRSFSRIKQNNQAMSVDV